MKSRGLLESTAALLTALSISHSHAATLYSDVVLKSKPVAYWSFDETEGNAVQQVPLTVPPLNNSLNDLTPRYGATRVSHVAANSGLQLGNAIDLNGQGDFFGTSDGLDLGIPSISGPWAIEFWFQLKGDQSARYFLNMGSRPVGYNSPAIIYGYFGTTIEVYGADNGRSGTKGVPLNDRNWHHLLVVNYGDASGATPSGGANRVDFYIDNVPYIDVGGNFSKAIDFTDWLFFGSAVADPDPTQSGSVNARLDELAFYDLGEHRSPQAVTDAAAALAASHYAAAFGSASVGTITLTSQPVDVTSQVGATATFSVAATVTGTTSPLAYQWQRNEANIVGATNATYTLPEISINEIGTNRFRVRVSAGPAFKFSQAAGLFVPKPPQPAPTYYTAQVQRDAPVLYWNFDEFLGDAQQIIPIAAVPVTSENDLVAVGSAEQRANHADIASGLGKLGKAAILDGSGFFIADNPRLGKSIVTNAYALELWVRVDGGQNEYLANFGPAGGDNTPAIIHNFTQPGFLELYGDGGRVGDRAGQITDNAWHHLVWVVYNNRPAGSTNRVDLYLDGTLKENVGNGFGRNLNLRRILVGAATAGGNNGLTGAIDEFAAYDFAGLTLEQVAERAAAIATNHYAAAKSASGVPYSQLVLSDNPVIYYNFEEASGKAVQRAPVTVPPSNNGANTLVNAGALRVDHRAARTGLELGHAADFNGVSYFRAATPQPPKLVVRAPWAVEYWFQVQGENNDNRQDYFLNFDNAPAFIFDFNPNELEIYAGTRTAGGPVVADQAWHHVLWVVYGDGEVGVADRVDAYFDGALIPNIRNNYSGALGLGRGIVVGAAQPGYNGFQGRMDEVAVYDLGSLGSEAAVTAKVTAMVSAHLAAAKTVVPTLTWARQAGNLVLSWSGNGFQLQQSQSLGNGGNWVDVANGNNSPASVRIESAGNRFFRLVQR